jgi:hypothetical protein
MAPTSAAAIWRGSGWGAGVYFQVVPFKVAGEFEVQRVGQDARDAPQDGQERPVGGLSDHLGEEGGNGDAGEEVGDAFHSKWASLQVASK